MIKLKHIIFFLPFFLLACKKEQLLNRESASPVSFNLKGAVLTTDTLELVYNNKVLGEYPYSKAPFGGALFTPGDKLQLRKKADHKLLKEFEVVASPYNQVKKFFYDGTTLSDNVTLTPVSNPDNIGFRFRFSTTFKGFYGGPVDIEFFDVDANTFEIISYMKVKNVTGSFGDFVEFEPLKPDHDYYFKVYKAGTDQLPYTSMENVETDAESNYERIIYSGDFKKGSSKLISISPNILDGYKIGYGYSLGDLTSVFN